ncbi:FAD-binding oxidoreductase [Amycolatopsis sp. K13G38]|uniref:FAD-binding oxidoreductase n=1 Tax=Amycolatopsis acididurans TaxID=2724524 RepID=A0ABX1JDR7_9PSEU|nr:FAD-dependent oxidoreductase [Amycolatopsis acididurans]NKQ56810.1 FAD-binding oxidoreductase [Amycolatopsis acididurans]
MRVIVIGSGIAGAGTAYQLVLRGADVVVVDEERPGVATEAGAGIVCPWTSRAGREHYALASVAAAFYPRLAESLAEDGIQDSSFEIVGGMVVSSDERELEEAYDRVTRRAAPEAGEVRRLDPAQARELFPALSPELGAVHVAGGGRVDGRRLRRALLTAAAKRGATILPGHAELFAASGAVEVRVGGTPVDTDKIVVAAGAWSAELLAPLGVSLAVAPQRGQISHFGLPEADTATWPVVLPVSSHYLLAFPDSRVVAGATRETGSGFDHRVTAGGQREVLEHALAVAPGLAEATLLETRIGFRPATPDQLPLLGPLDGQPDVLVATGFGASGLTVAPFAGALIAALAVGEPPAIDVTPYRPGRHGVP